MKNSIVHSFPLKNLNKKKEKQGKKSFEKVACTFIDYLVENDQYFRMMTHFMLDGDLSPVSIEKLNKMERALLDRFDNMFKKQIVALFSQMFIDQCTRKTG